MTETPKISLARKGATKSVQWSVRWGAQVATLAAVLLFTACQAPTNSGGAGESGSAPSGDTAQSGGSQSGASSDSESTKGDAEKSQSVARLDIPRTSAVPQTRLSTKPIAEQLDGLVKSRVADRFGTPDFLRREATAEIWQYRGTRCTIDVFFDGRDGNAKVNHVDVRSLGVAKLDDAACLADIGASRPSS